MNKTTLAICLLLSGCGTTIESSSDAGIDAPPCVDAGGDVPQHVAERFCDEVVVEVSIEKR